MKYENSEPKGSHNKMATWGQDIIKAKLTQELRGDDVADNRKIFQFITHIITAILSGLAGFFTGGN